MKGRETPIRKLLLTTLALLLISLAGKASHIVGGEMSYSCLGNDYYQVSLRFYRDCSGVIMPPTADILVADPTGTVLQTFTVNKGPTTTLNVNQPGCGQPAPTVCIETAEYVVDSVYLPAGPSFYVIYTQECCRNNNVDNIANAWSVGVTFPAYIYPGNFSNCNSSANLGVYPPVAIPQNVPLSIPVGAADPDGDSLYFQLCAPLGSSPTSYPFGTVPFAAGYSAGNMVPASPGLTIDSKTGVINGTVTQQGQFAISICINEYRNGKLVGKSRRDYQFVVVMPWKLFASITAKTDASCGSGGSATVNAAGASGPYTYSWSHGPTTASVSNLPAGTYMVTASNGTCSDTTSVIIKGGAPFTAAVSSKTDLPCGANSGASATLSIVGGASPYTIIWPSGPGGLSNNQLNLGSNKVAITDANGCSDTVTIQINQAGPGLQLNLDSVKATSCGVLTDGYAAVSVSGGTAPYTYIWSDANTGAVRNPIAGGAYGVKVLDANGCKDSIAINIPSTPGFSLSWDSIKNVSCHNAANGYLKAVIQGGSAPFSYNWSNAGTGSFIQNIAPGNYSLTVTDAAGCSETISTIITEPDSLLINLNLMNQVTCPGGNDGQILVGAQGGTAPYSYSWSNGRSGSLADSLVDGTYTVTLTDSNGCSTTRTYTIAQPSPIVANVDSIIPAGCGAANGEVWLSTSGGRGPLNIHWSNGNIGTTATGLSSGSYQAIITDSYGCKDSITVVVTGSSSLSLNIDSVKNPDCSPQNGFSKVVVSGGVAPYSYQWSNGSVADTAMGLGVGNHHVIVTDAVGCKDSIAVNLVASSAPVIGLQNLQNPACFGDSTGLVGIAVTGGAAPYTINWNTGGTGTIINNLSSGNYTVNLTDANGCTATKTFALTEPDSLWISAKSVVQPTCTLSGEIKISIKGGTSPYTIAWSNGASDSTVSNLPSGTYNVVVTDSNGCAKSAVYTLSPSSGISVTVDSVKNASCGLQNGAAAITVSGGTSPYQVVWSNSQSGTFINNLAPGNYQAVVTDSSGCIDSINIAIGNQPLFTASLDTVIQPSCFGNNDGTARVIVQGGNGPITYLWSNQTTADTAANLAPGNHYVIISDSSGCQDSLHFVLYSPLQLQLTLDSLKNPTCFGSQDGHLSISISGGQAPYNILWSTSDTVSTLNNLGSGNYGVTVSDSRGCSFSNSFQLTSPDSIGISLKNKQDVLCYADSSGVLEVSIYGGEKPYSLQWSNGATDSTISNLAAGNYSLTITDSLGCSAQHSFNISQPSMLSLNVDSIIPETCGQQNGGAIVSVAGGVAPYTWLWSSNSNLPTIQAVAAGTYNVIVTDANGCVDSLSVTIPGSGTLTAVIDSSRAPFCAGSASGFARVSSQGGVAPFTYLWSNGSVSDTATSLVGGHNFVIVQDAVGCKDSISFQLTDPDSVKIDLVNIEHAECFGLTGNLEVNVSGGAAPYQLNWSNNASGNRLFALKAGTYSLNVIDSKGCAAMASYTIEQPDSFAVVIDSIRHPVCAGESTGEVYLRALGNNHISTIVANRGKVGAAGITDLTAGTYSVWVQDSVGCGVNVSFTIKDPQPLVVQDLNIVHPGCSSNDPGFIELAVTGGRTPYTYQWSDGSTSLNRYNLSGGNYEIWVTDSSGCTVHRSFELFSDSVELRLDIRELSCKSYADAEVKVEVVGAAKPFTLRLNGEQVYEGIMDVQAGQYTLELQDARGCTISRQFEAEEGGELKLYCASAFTPDGDGINDLYKIDGSKECFTSARLEIYNRWGQRIFETDNPFTEFWDGRLSNGLPKSDIYIYSFTSDQMTQGGQLKILQ